MGKKFTIRTDHGSLRWLSNFKDVQGQLARWIETLSGFDYEICYRQGCQHKHADSLSRIPFENEARPVNVNIVNDKVNSCSLSVFSGLDPVGLRQAQRNDDVLAPIIKMKESSAERPPGSLIGCLSRETKGYWNIWDQLELEQGTLYRRYVDNSSSNTKQLVIPRSLQREVVQLAHDSRTGGHLGRTKTFKKIQRQYYWIGYRSFIANWIKQCEKCAKRKTPIPKFRSSLKPSLVGAPFERVSLDILGPLPRSKTGNRYILIVMDYFTSSEKSGGRNSSQSVG